MKNRRLLPSYERPPVQEVALAVQYRAQLTPKTADLVGFWQTVRDRFPEVEDLQPLIGAEERVGSFELLQLPPLRRLRMSDPAGQVSIQLQETHFITNWVKTSPEAVYPRFKTIYKDFEKYYNRLLAYFSDNKLGNVSAVNFELTYVNELGQVSPDLMSRLPGILKLYNWDSEETAFLGTPSAINLIWQLPMPVGAGKMLITVNTARRLDGSEVILLIFKCFGPAVNLASEAEIEDWFEAAHESIVRGFTELTTADAHLDWGRIDERTTSDSSSQ